MKNNWKLHKTIHKGIGTLCEVKLDEPNGLVSRRFAKDAITVNGGGTRFNEDEIENFFNNEVFLVEETPEQMDS